MAIVKVYRYDYFDRLLKHDRRSVDYATADAIAGMGGTILAESVREVDEGMLPASGIVRAADLQKAQVEASEEEGLVPAKPASGRGAGAQPRAR